MRNLLRFIRTFLITGPGMKVLLFQASKGNKPGSCEAKSCGAKRYKARSLSEIGWDITEYNPENDPENYPGNDYGNDPQNYPGNYSTQGEEYIGSNLTCLPESSYDLIIVDVEKDILVRYMNNLKKLLKNNGVIFYFGHGDEIGEGFIKKSYTIVSSYRYSRFAMPVDCSGRIMRNSFCLFNPSKLLPKLQKAFLRVLFEFRPIRCLFPTVTIYSRSGSMLYESWIRGLTGEDSVLSFLTGTPGSHRKVTLQVMDQRGGISGYAKVVSGHGNTEYIENERDILSYLSSFSFKSFKIPSVKLYKQEGEASFLYQTGQIYKNAGPLDIRHIKALAEIYLKTRTCIKLSETDTFNNIIKSNPCDILLEAGFDSVESVKIAIGRLIENGSDFVDACTVHGDFVTWNVRNMPGGNIYIFDWEFGSKKGLPLLDLLHYIIQRELLAKGRNSAYIMNIVYKKHWRLIEKYMLETNIKKENFEFYFMIYILHNLSRVCEETSRLRKDKKVRWQVQQIICMLKYCTSEMGGNCREDTDVGICM